MLQETSRPGVLDTLREITATQTAREKLLTWRYPWFNVVYNYLIALIVFGLCCSLYGWGLDVWAQRRADQQTKATVEAMEMARQEEEAAKAAELAAARMSEEAVLDRWATAGAKMLYGVRLFRDKYNYNDSDYKTYLQCTWNRYLFGNKLTDIETIIAQKDQFLGYYDTSPVLDELYELCKAFYTEKLHETTLVCDPGYRWAELTPQGIYLVNEFGAGPYARRFHA